MNSCLGEIASIRADGELRKLLELIAFQGTRLLGRGYRVKSSEI